MAAEAAEEVQEVRRVLQAEEVQAAEDPQLLLHQDLGLSVHLPLLEDHMLQLQVIIE